MFLAMQAASTGKIAYTGNTVHTDCTYKQREFATVEIGNSYCCACLYSQQQMMRAQQATVTAATSYTGNMRYCDYLNRPHFD